MDWVLSRERPSRQIPSAAASYERCDKPAALMSGCGLGSILWSIAKPALSAAASAAGKEALKAAPAAAKAIVQHVRKGRGGMVQSAEEAARINDSNAQTAIVQKAAAIAASASKKPLSEPIVGAGASFVRKPRARRAPTDAATLKKAVRDAKKVAKLESGGGLYLPGTRGRGLY